MPGKRNKVDFSDHVVHLNAKISGMGDSGAGAIRAAEIAAAAVESSARIRGRYAIGVAILAAVNLWLLENIKDKQVDTYKKLYEEESVNVEKLKAALEFYKKTKEKPYLAFSFKPHVEKPADKPKDASKELK